MRKIVFASKKGGVSKTTSAILTSLILSEEAPTLLIDLDSQNALTSFFFDDLTLIQGKSILEAIKGEKLFDQVIQNVGPNLDVIPSVLEFEEIDEWQRTGKELILKKELKQVEDKYEYVVIDTPPNLRTETVLGLVAADIIIIPARLEKMDTRAIDFTVDKTINQIKDDFNPTLEKILILASQYNYQNRTVNDLAYDTLKEEYGDMVLDIKVQNSSKISQFLYMGYQGKFNRKDFPEYVELAGILK
jgi:chromosome partitioning protein